MSILFQKQNPNGKRKKAAPLGREKTGSKFPFIGEDKGNITGITFKGSESQSRNRPCHFSIGRGIKLRIEEHDKRLVAEAFKTSDYNILYSLQRRAVTKSAKREIHSRTMSVYHMEELMADIL